MKFKVKIHLFLIAAVLIWAACRKTDSKPDTNEQAPSVKESRFFSEHRSSNPQVAAITQWVKQQNDKQNFVTQTIKQIGYPRWDKALITNRLNKGARGAADSSLLVYVPFVRDSQNYVNASMIVALNANDTTLSYICDWQYTDKVRSNTSIDSSAESYAMFFMYFTKNTLGQRKFRITDTTLFASHPRGTSTERLLFTIIDTTSGRLSGRLETNTNQICYPGFFCGAPESPDCSQGCDWQNCSSDPDVCHFVLNCITYPGGDNGSGGVTGTPETGGGGSGSGGTPPTSPCPTTTTGNRGSIYENCGPGWVPVNDDPPGVLANQSIIDSLQGYPCAQGILAELPSCNTATQNILQNIFGVNDNVNIFFVADSTLPANVNAQTQGSSIQFDPNTGGFKVRIRLNTWVLTNSSKEFIAKTMFHESIHAMIDYQWKKYTNGLMDSTTFKLMFPKIWDYKKQPYSNIAQHTQIAHSFVDSIKSVVRGYNPGIADSVNKAISWSGLYETQAWKDLGNDTLQLNRLRLVARGDTSVLSGQIMTSHNLHKCN